MWESRWRVFLPIPFAGTVLLSSDWAPLVTVLWVLGMTNAVNFIDGLDGLAAGILAIAAGAFFLYGHRLAETGIIGPENISPLLAVIVLGICVGFLPFNFHPARIFMGDVGSQFVGFMLAVLAVVASRLDGVMLSFLLVPMLLSGVLFDVAFTLVRRASQGEPVTRPHRGHLYQVAQRSGLSPVVVTLVHWSFALFGGGCCLLFIAAPSQYKPLVPFIRRNRRSPGRRKKLSR